MAHLWLIGMMGSGKSSLGISLANRLGVRFVDIDDEVATRMGCSISQLWGTVGERAFRDMEAAAIERVAAEPDAVVATGGGVVLRQSNVDAMRSSGTVAWLQADVAVLARRVGDGSGRPLLDNDDPKATLTTVLAEREAAYDSASDAAVDTSRGRNHSIDALEALWNAGS